MAAVFCTICILLTGCGKKTVENDYVRLGDYEGIAVEMVKAEVSDQEVEDEIAFQIDINTESTQITDRPAQSGDTVLIDFEGTIDGEEFDGGSGYGYTIVIGDGVFLEELENGMIGMEPGEEKDITVTFPENYEETVAGKEAVFHITLYSIQRVTTPEYTDEFVQSVSSYETREEYEEAIRNELLASKEQEAREETAEELIQKIIEDTEFKEIPEELYESCRAQKERQNQYEEELFGISLEDMGITQEDTEAEIDEMVRERLVLEAIAQEEEIEVTQEECDEYIAQNMDYYGYNTAEQMEEVYGSDGIEAAVLKEKVSDFLIEHAEITEVDERSEDLDLATGASATPGEA